MKVRPEPEAVWAAVFATAYVAAMRDHADRPWIARKIASDTASLAVVGLTGDWTAEDAEEAKR